MELFIDHWGRAPKSCGVAVDKAVWEDGLIHIRQQKRAVIVSLSPELVNGTTVAAAFYRIADLNPAHICLVTSQSNRVPEVFVSCNAAFRRIYAILSAVRRVPGGRWFPMRREADNLAMPEAESGPEHIIAATIERHSRKDSETLAHAILEALWEAGHDVHSHRNIIPAARP